MARDAKTDHVAFVTGDTEKTVDFYCRVMGWPLVGAHRGVEPDGRRFFISAFAAPGFFLEFEEVEDRPPAPAYAAGFPHFGIDVGSAEAYEEWKAHLARCEVAYLEMTPGDLFVTDPNGVSFQLLVKQPDAAGTVEERSRRAGEMVAAWVDERRDARATATGLRTHGLRARLSGPVLGAPDAWALAEFYGSLLGWKLVDRSEGVPGGWALLRSPNGQQKLEFQREEPFAPPVWPTVEGEPQMGMHLDIAIDGLPPLSAMDDRRALFGTAVDHAVSLGARVAEHQPQEGRVVVLLDPAGHPFCLFPGTP
jgi:catechol 2,3-dioxygenase-like lactoylglutathione lyase family enzyme